MGRCGSMMHMSTSTTPTKKVRIRCGRFSGQCGYCGAMKYIPSHPTDQIAPRPVPTCEHVPVGD